MRPGRPGFATSLHVRLLHCMIRARIVNHREWDRSHLGIPISQFNMFTTLMAGSIISGTQLRSIGYRTTDDDIVAMLHMWRYIGYVMGVDTPWYPETIDDGYRAMRLIALSQRTEDNDDSRKLCHSFMDSYQPSPGARGWARAKAELNYRFQLGHAYFYTPGSYVKSGFPEVGPWRFAPLVRFVPNYLRDTACQTVPGVGRLVDRRHRAWRRLTLLNDGRPARGLWHGAGLGRQAAGKPRGVGYPSHRLPSRAPTLTAPAPKTITQARAASPKSMAPVCFPP